MILATSGRRSILRALEVCATACLFLFSAQALESQQPQENDGTQHFIVRVEIVGNRSVQLETIRAKILLRPGDVYNAEAVQRDAQALRDTGYFTEVRLSITDDPDRPNGKIVAFDVIEKTPQTSTQMKLVNRELSLTVQPDATEVGQPRVPKFRVELRNVGTADLILNLGIMLANGRQQYPKDIVLIVTDSQGKARRFDLKEPHYVAGRLDPLIAPLPVGSTFSISVDLDNYWAAASSEFEYKLKPGTYFLEAEFSGRAVTQQEANLDVKGIALMPYWTGSIISNRLRFEVLSQYLQ